MTPPLPDAQAAQAAMASQPWGLARDKRLGQLIWLLFGLMLVSLVTRASAGSLTYFPWVQLTALGLLVAAYGLLRRGARALASALTLGSVAVALLVLMALNEGLRDEAVVALPGVLILATLLGSRRQMLVLLAMMLASVVALGVANVQGWYVNPMGVTNGSTAFDVALVLAASGFFMFLLGGDLNAAIASLREENLRARVSQDEAAHLAAHDALTGLPNRRSLRARFGDAREAAQAGAHLVALLFVDLDDFKSLNDTRGHAAGDDMLRAYGQRLQAVVGEAGTVAREGGDEFLVLLHAAADREAVEALAQRLLDAVSAPLDADGVEVELSASIGVALYPDHGAGFHELLKKADVAMYRVKHGGRRGWRVFDAEMEASVKDHLMLVPRIRRAIQHGEFELHYQPQLDLASGRVIGAEALLRWNTEDLGRVSPARFIPVAEQSGQIVELGAWVLRQACRQAADWHAQGLQDLIISVNLSPVQLRRGSMERDVLAALEASGLRPAALDLEITESLLLENSEQLARAINGLRSHGVGFSIDDFGTGNANLAYLRQFDFERLKIDQSFIRTLLADEGNQAIVNAILQLAGALQLGVIAEGVEDAATLAHLRELGCPQGQGFHWSPALPAEQFLAWVRRQPAHQREQAAAA